MAGGKELDASRLLEIVEESKNFQPIYYITGGEPLIYNNLFEVIRAMKENRSIVALSSNGFELPSLYKDIVDSGIDYLSLSLDGSEPHLHDRNRKLSGCFEHLIGGLQDLIRYRGDRIFPNIKINTVIRRENLKDLVRTFRLSESLGVDQFQLQHYSFHHGDIEKLSKIEAKKYPVGTEVQGGKIDHDFYLTPEETGRLKKAIHEIRKLARQKKIQFLMNHDGEDLHEYYSGTMHSKASWCHEVFRTLNIRQSGQVELCQGNAIGNIYDRSIKDIWRSDMSRAIMSHFLQHRCSISCYRCCSLNIKYQQDEKNEEWHAYLTH